MPSLWKGPIRASCQHPESTSFVDPEVHCNCSTSPPAEKQKNKQKTALNNTSVDECAHL